MGVVKKSDVARYVGMSAVDAYMHLLAEHRVQRISVFEYNSPPSLQRRIQISPTEKELIDQALKLRQTTQLPFWNCLLTTCLLSGTHTSNLVEAVFFHNGPGKATSYDRSAIETGLVENLVRGDVRNFGLSSEVRDVNGYERHLQLMDFHCEISTQNEALADLVCRHLMPDGFLLVDSGDSYHACGFRLLMAEERVRMLGKALLAAPIVDSHYIAHQLQQGASSIRISKGGKEFRDPRVVRAWGPAP